MTDFNAAAVTHVLSTAGKIEPRFAEAEPLRS
jgi:hypothetical protein